MSDDLPSEIVARLRQLIPDATGKSYVWGRAMKDAADEIERLRRTRDELLIYINGVAKNSAKVVEAMRVATDSK